MERLHLLLDVAYINKEILHKYMHDNIQMKTNLYKL